jgi:hypothetical protein
LNRGEISNAFIPIFQRGSIYSLNSEVARTLHLDRVVPNSGTLGIRFLGAKKYKRMCCGLWPVAPFGSPKLNS